jgi:ankyrin repeat protein
MAMLASRLRHDAELLARTSLGATRYGGDTLLMRAVKRDDLGRVHEILAACPTPAARLVLVETPNTSAAHAMPLCNARSGEMARVLQDAGTTQQWDGGVDDPFVAACERDVGVLEALLESLGSDEERQERAQRLLSRACIAPECTGAHLQLLLDAGADVNACDTHGRTPLYWAAFSSHFSDVARDAARRDGVVAALLARGASVGCADALRRTPLHIAAGGKDGGAVHALAVAPGADVDALDAVGLSPLACAAGAGNRAAVALLLTCGADARGGAHVGGVQPAHAARAQGHRELAALLDRAAARAGRPTAAKAGATIWRHLAYTRASRSLDVGLFLLMIDVDEFRQEAAEERKQRLAFFIMSSAVKALAPPPTRHAPWWQLWRPRGARVEPA